MYQNLETNPSDNDYSLMQYFDVTRDPTYQIVVIVKFLNYISFENRPVSLKFGVLKRVQTQLANNSLIEN